jgi:hypothetical protein
MNRLAKLMLFALPFGLTNAHAADSRVRDFTLDDHAVYTVPVSEARVTTIGFPSPISAIDGALLTSDGKTPGAFQIAHTKGTAYLSLRALAKDVATNLNVRWNNRTYAFELHESTQPWYSVVLQTKPAVRNHSPLPLTPPRLLGLLDKAKAFPLLKNNAPDEVANVEYRDLREKPAVSDCGDYEIRLTEVFRFADEDTLVFHVVIANKSDQPLDHTPEKLEVHVGDRMVFPSVTDLASAIAPHQSTIGYVAVNGGPAGPNDLSLKNDFTFVLSRREAAAEAMEPDSKDIEPAPLPR